MTVKELIDELNCLQDKFKSCNVVFCKGDGLLYFQAYDITHIDHMYESNEIALLTGDE